MMGPKQVAQGALFYEFSIEDHVPPAHLLRAMERFVDLGDMRPDTLIVRPAQNEAEILWRIQWDADLEPLDTYRSVQIREGGF